MPFAIVQPTNALSTSLQCPEVIDRIQERLKTSEDAPVHAGFYEELPLLMQKAGYAKQQVEEIAEMISSLERCSDVSPSLSLALAELKRIGDQKDVVFCLLNPTCDLSDNAFSTHLSYPDNVVIVPNDQFAPLHQVNGVNGLSPQQSLEHNLYFRASRKMDVIIKGYDTLKDDFAMVSWIAEFVYQISHCVVLNAMFRWA